MVGACHHRSFSVPPWPRCPPLAAGLAAAVGASVRAGAAGAVVAAAAGAVVACAAGAVVGLAAGAAAGVGAAGVAAGPHAASTNVRADRKYAARLIREPPGTSSRMPEPGT